MEPSKPSLTTRLLIIASLLIFLRVAKNPLVIIEARLGLSPSPLERLVGIEGPFSAMTEASHRLAHFDLSTALDANPLVLVFWASVGAMILLWRFPRMNQRSDEVALFSVALLATLINNLA